LTTSVAREIVPLLAACDLGGVDPLASADAAFEHATYAWQRLDPGPDTVPASRDCDHDS